MSSGPEHPAAGVPTGTSTRFAVLVLTIIVSTGSVFGYLWQMSRPGLQAGVRHCMSGQPEPLAGFIGRLSRGPGADAYQVALCLRPVCPQLTAWFLIGAVALVIVSLAIYGVTPWWMIHVGGMRSRRRLAVLDPDTHPMAAGRLAELVADVGLPGQPAFYVDESEPGRSRAGARAFGHQRRACIRLDQGLLDRYERAAPPGRRDEDRAAFTDVVLHELAHLRNRDNRPTYLTLAAWRAFVAVTSAGYLAMLAVAGTRPAVPDPRTLLALVSLAGLVLLGTRAVLRMRELHADATAASCHPERTLRTVFKQARRRPPPRWRRAWRYHPDWADRAAALRAPQRLYRADGLAMFSAGVAIALAVSDLIPTGFAVVVAWWPGAGPALMSPAGIHPLLLMLVTFGPAALLAATAVAALACATTRRLRYRHLAGLGPVPALRLAVPMALGMLAGGLLDFSDALAGTWGVLDTSVAGDLAVTALSLALTVVALTALFRWAAESAAVGLTGRRRRTRVTETAAVLLGGLGLAPALFAWNLTRELPLSQQILWGPDRGQRPLIGGWPAVSALFAHYTPLGAFDIVPGNAFLLALPCAFVAAMSLRRDGRMPPAGPFPAGAGPLPRVPLRAVTAGGFLGAVVSLAAALVLVLALRAAVGGRPVLLAGGYGLIYLARATEAAVAVCAGAAAAWAARKAEGIRLTTGILTALIAAACAAVAVPQVLYIGELGWPHNAVNHVDSAVLYGIIGTLQSGRVVISTLAFLAAGGGISAVRRARRRQPGSPVPAGGPRAPWLPGAGSWLAGASLLTFLLGALGVAAYYFATLGLSSTG
jgi:Peptidase family M48